MRPIMTKCLFFGVLILSAPSAIANLVAPNGNPSSPPSATDGIITSTLDPSPAIYMKDCPWFIPALSAQGIDNDGLDNIPGNADDWTLTFPDLFGTIFLDAYYPWVNQAPAITVGGHTWAAKNKPGQGGATLALSYKPKPNTTDPTGNDVHWVQVIKTNDPMGNQAKYDAGGGYSWYIDNDGNPAGNPFYDFPVPGFVPAAGDDWFFDRPSRFPVTDWEAQAFIATGDPATRTLALYDGVYWGFEVVPVPGSLTLALIGLGYTSWRVRKRKLAKQGTVT